MNQSINISKGTRISFRFQPFEVEKSGHAEERVVRGQRRRYLKGLSSGIRPDLDGERMTKSCIKSMHKQGNSGSLLLYGGLHGVNFLDDLGILDTSQITQEGDWYTEYRLYDESDMSGVDKASVERANKLWAQVNGLPPYKKAIQKGFSIEGIIPEGAIIDAKKGDDGSMSHRVIDDIELDGTVVVSRPAYGDSVVTAVYKALGILPPGAVDQLHKNLHSTMVERLRDEENARSFYQQWFLLNDVLQEQIEKIMRISDDRKSERLGILLDEYKAALIPLVLQNEEFFRPEPPQPGEAGITAIERSEQMSDVIGRLTESAMLLGMSLKSRIPQRRKGK